MSYATKRRLGRAILLCASLFMLEHVAPAHAQRPDDDEDVAKALYQAGKAAYEDGKYADALKYFEQAYEQSQRPRMLYNIGQAADRLRDDARALAAFRRFLELVPDDPVRPSVELRVAALERSVAEREAAQRDAPTVRAEQAAVLSPAAAAGSAAPEAGALAGGYDPTLDAPVDRGPESGSVFGQWWFWTVTGVVIAGGVTALVLVLPRDESGSAKPIAGEVGGVVQTLGRF